MIASMEKDMKSSFKKIVKVKFVNGIIMGDSSMAEGRDKARRRVITVPIKVLGKREKSVVRGASNLRMEINMKAIGNRINFMEMEHSLKKAKELIKEALLKDYSKVKEYIPMIMEINTMEISLKICETEREFTLGGTETTMKVNGKKTKPTERGRF